MDVNGEPWTPQNFDEVFEGPVTARHALAYSRNVPTIRAAEMIGLRDVVRMARRCGIESRLQAVPSIALGTFEVVPLEAAAAFTPIANLGTRVGPWAVTAVIDDGGNVTNVPPSEPKQVVSEQAAYLTLDLMRDVVLYGTGAGIWSFGPQGEFAGKTGTTDDGRDNWFVGFNPDYLALTWVGFDNNRALKLGGSVLALPIWAELTARAGIDRSRGWERPEGIIEQEIDPETGQIAGWHCPDSAREIFIAGAVPVECESHLTSGESWAARAFRWFRRD
jgi:membrane carboxypeptidase/penicillin-binding protein